MNEFFDAVWFGVVKYIKVRSHIGCHQPHRVCCAVFLHQAVRTVLYYLLLWPLLRVWRQLGRLSDWIDRLPCTERLGSAVERGCMRCGRGCAVRSCSLPRSLVFLRLTFVCACAVVL